MAPAVADGVDLLVAQNEALLRSTGATDAEVATVRAFAERALSAARDGDLDVAEQAVRDYYGGVWDGLDATARAVAGERTEYIERQVGALLPVYGSEQFRSLLSADPEADWERVRVPVLGVFGGKDVQVVLEQNEPALRAALEAAGNEDHGTIIFPDANHLFQTAETGAIEEYGSLAPEFTPGFVDAIVDWVVERAGVAG
jgi:pimeloyl-ACP methyl ester carboxylesterase